MSRFSLKNCISHADNDVADFVHGYLGESKSVLFIGTVGLEPSSLFFPTQLSTAQRVDFRFIVETRPGVQTSLLELGELHREYLRTTLSRADCVFTDVEVIASDGATVAGRNAVVASGSWSIERYTDIVVDATGMSRGTCFPIVRQVLQAAKSGINVHLLVASNEIRHIGIRSESNDRADWMHGFQADMGMDRSNDALKLWVPQLTERAAPMLNLMYRDLSPIAEVCPIVPFPSANPRRGDDLVFQYQDQLVDQWESNVLSLIYAHESDPLDVYRSIVRMHSARFQAFSAAKQRPATVLSPAGWRIGSLGMLLAALDLELPIFYVETIGYSSDSELPEEVIPERPNNLWHIWLAGSPYGSHEAQ